VYVGRISVIVRKSRLYLVMVSMRASVDCLEFVMILYILTVAGLIAMMPEGGEKTSLVLKRADVSVLRLDVGWKGVDWLSGLPK